jgi:hypothetical protein
MHPGLRPSRNDLRIGIKIGLLYAIGFSLLASLVYLVVGGRAFVQRNGADLPIVLASYAFGGLAGGLFIGLLRPLRFSRWGAFCMGTVAVIPVLAALMVVILPRAEWYPPGVVMIVILAVILGGGSTVVQYDKTKGWTT